MSSEIKNFYRFYILQLLVFSSGLVRTTAIGYISYQLGISPQELGLMTSISMMGMVLGHFSIPYLQKYYTSSQSLYLFSQKTVVLICLTLMFYMVLGIYQGNWGNFWLWTVMSSISGFCISVEQASRPLFVKQSFPNLNFSRIMRQDVMTMGFAKVVGFASGILIVSKLWVVLAFLLGAIICILMIYYTTHMKVVPIISCTKEKIEKSAAPYLSYKTTMLVYMLTYLLLFPINTQVVTYSKIWNIPFYWFYIVASLGNIFFNLFLNKTVGLQLHKAFIVYILCLGVGFSLFLSSSSFVLLGAFLVGGVYSSLNALSTSRIYESGVSPKYISRFYVFGSLISILGTYNFGLMLEYFSKNSVFIFLILFSLSAYTIIYILDKYWMSKNTTVAGKY